MLLNPRLMFIVFCLEKLNRLDYLLILFNDYFLQKI